MTRLCRKQLGQARRRRRVRSSPIDVLESIAQGACSVSAVQNALEGSMTTTKRKFLLASLALVTALAIVMVIWKMTFLIEESATPDVLDLGEVDRGAQVEFSVRFLASSHRTALERWLERLGARVPAAEPVLSRLRPKGPL